MAGASLPPRLLPEHIRTLRLRAAVPTAAPGGLRVRWPLLVEATLRDAGVTAGAVQELLATYAAGVSRCRRGL